jgi:hypothetical protein
LERARHLLAEYDGDVPVSASRIVSACMPQIVAQMASTDKPMSPTATAISRRNGTQYEFFGICPTTGPPQPKR